MSRLETDVLVIGCGPAGLQAAIHSARAKAKTVVVGKPSGSAAHGTRIENLFGFSGVADGTELIDIGMSQARSFGAEVVESNILSARRDGAAFVVSLEDGSEVRAKAVVLAMGISRKKLNVPGEKELLGKGVSYCASCDCNFYKGRVVAIVGAQSEAAVSAELMTRYASKVYWITPEVDADKALLDRAVSAGVERVEASVTEIRGDGKVTSVLVSDSREILIDGIFIELGGKSSADVAMDLDVMPEMDDTIKVSPDMSTEVPGVFACGDLTGRPWQVAKAVGEGAVAGLSASSYAKKAGL